MRGPQARRARTTAAGILAVLFYAATIGAANAATTWWPPVVALGLTAPAGALFAGLAFTARDLVHDITGPRRVLAAIAAGSALSWWLATPALAAASTLAFAISELADLIVYTPMHARHPLLAVAASNTVGLLVDSVLFLTVAFGTLAFLPGQIAAKLATTLAAVAALAAIRRWRHSDRRCHWLDTP